MQTKTNKLVKLGMLSALSLLLILTIRIPLIPAAPFLEYEAGDVPILIGTFVFGPGAGVAVTTVVSLLQALSVSAGSGWIGAIMHIVATGTLVIVAGFIYQKFRTLKGAIAGLILGSLSMILVMIPMNLLFTTKFLNIPIDVVKTVYLPLIIQFNLLKAGINSILTLLVYKSVKSILVPEADNCNRSKTA